MTDKELKYNELREKIYRDMRDYDLMMKPYNNSYVIIQTYNDLRQHIAVSLKQNIINLLNVVDEKEDKTK